MSILQGPWEFVRPVNMCFVDMEKFYDQKWVPWQDVRVRCSDIQEE